MPVPIEKLDNLFEKLESNKPDSAKIKENVKILESSNDLINEAVQEATGEYIEEITGGSKPHQLPTLKGILKRVDDKDFEEVWGDSDDNKILGDVDGLEDVYMKWEDSRKKIENITEVDLEKVEELENLEKVKENKDYRDWVARKKRVLNKVESKLKEVESRLEESEEVSAKYEKIQQKREEIQRERERFERFHEEDTEGFEAL